MVLGYGRNIQIRFSEIVDLSIRGMIFQKEVYIYLEHVKDMFVILIFGKMSLLLMQNIKD